jgi:hypothetical protein
MNEIFLSFLWKYKMFQQANLTWDNDSIEILHPGHTNTNAGPDFTDARIKIGDTLWAGNVEIHVNASDWELHNHDKNSAYNNVVLHVVGNFDKDIYTAKGRKVPTIALPVDEKVWDNYQTLINTQSWLPCASSVSKIDQFTIQSWKQSVGIERLHAKVDQIQQNLDSTTNDWDEVFFRLLVHSFGFHVNTVPFSLLAGSTPYKVVRKHSSNIAELEALLFGQAGFLFDDYNDDTYYTSLKKTYAFLQAKYNLKSVDVHLWKYLRLRPVNFPTIRIAQLAGLLYKNQELLSDILHVRTLEELQNLINCATSEYWHTHYLFNRASKNASKSLGKNSANSIIINTIIPFYFAYGELNGKDNLKEKALEFSELLPSEKNSIVTNWQEAGIRASNSFDSQALIHLANAYCAKKRCVDCRIGIKIIAENGNAKIQ